MDEATQILVIITSSVLILFLLLAMFGAVQFILLMRKVKKLVQKAENVTDTVESIGETIKAAQATIGISSVVTALINSITKATGTKRRK